MCAVVIFQIVKITGVYNHVPVAQKIDAERFFVNAFGQAHNAVPATFAWQQKTSVAGTRAPIFQQFKIVVESSVDEFAYCGSGF